MDEKPKSGARVWIFIAALLFIVIAAGTIFLLFSGDSIESFSTSSFDSGANCNVAAFDIHGCISTYAPDPSLNYDSGCDVITASEEIASYVRDAKDDDSVRAILLDIDSGGGLPQAAYEIEQALQDTGKPTVALIRSTGASAAYWIATAAKTIIASPMSDVGSIGVTTSYVDNAEKNAKEGLTYNSLSTGKFKDTGDPDKPLTAEEKAYIQKSLQKLFEQFIQKVSMNRHMTEEQVRALADGSTWLGEEALQKGLIDKIGTYTDAVEEIEKEIGEKAVVCWPQYSRE